MIQHYISLTKPRIVIGNIMSCASGFLIASRGHFNIHHCLIFTQIIIGMTLIIASSCVLNNIIDRDIDKIMERTKHRILASDENIIPLSASIMYACVLIALGFLFLYFIDNYYTISLTIIGVLIYVGLYSLWMKRKSVYSIIIGSISGAVPPVVGYCTVTHQFDLGAVILLLMFSLWQIPHSYSILIFRIYDYKMASIPSFPIKKGIEATRNHMLTCIFGFLITNVLLTTTGYTSNIFLYTMIIINLWWLYSGIYKYRRINDHYLWSKEMFILSIVIIILLNILLSIDSFLFIHK